MIQGFSISVSGLMAQSKRLAVSADNVANMRSRGVDPDGPREQPGAYQPKRVQDVTTGGGGVRGEVRPIAPASVRSYEPSSPDANSEGLVDRPNVNLAEELVTQIQAQRAYEANAAAIRTQDEITDSLLDIKS
ncbi:flagellar biosynthesis protein FlgG [Pelagibius litoralis]|uniref:Flagellar biosynthesis protein FlgG n=1 Tax=Pelagibius litoralis TaxID=374515 RepID=A0A967F0K5_9PROT|nr:flagellar basal body rod C-terminal domain-containing protein [Pelagibius litoralis]NIA70901.1 flagellar biosynthesis protein FlgG [Pelagibius litoralis]